MRHWWASAWKAPTTTIFELLLSTDPSFTKRLRVKWVQGWAGRYMPAGQQHLEKTSNKSSSFALQGKQHFRWHLLNQGVAWQELVEFCHLTAHQANKQFMWDIHEGACAGVASLPCPQPKNCPRILPGALQFSLLNWLQSLALKPTSKMTLISHLFSACLLVHVLLAWAWIVKALLHHF